MAKGFSLADDQVEFFCHSPFIKHCDEGDDLRNAAALVFQVRFEIGGTRTNYFAVGDSDHEVLGDIVIISTYHGRDDRLDWDLFNIPHHCSYLALAPEKGNQETAPTKRVSELLNHGQRDAYLISSSKPIPDNPAAYDQVQPPHVQAKKAYLRYLEGVGGRKLLVTMEEPNIKNPEPLVFEISGGGCRFISKATTGAAAIITSRQLRAGVR